MATTDPIKTELLFSIEKEVEFYWVFELQFLTWSRLVFLKKKLFSMSIA